ncbi:MAG: 2-dehydropantoate 2-reductase [Halieaceae bacterium]
MINQWHILGAGAMGKLLACKLARAGLEPVLLLRGGAAADVELRLRDGCSETVFGVPARPLDELDSSHLQALFITTKANQALEAFASVASRLPADIPIVLLHNGMGIYEQLLALHPELNLYCGTTTEGAYLEADGSLVHAGYGDTLIGQAGSTDAPGWFQPLAASDERFAWEADIDASLWRKLIINCAINPLTAVHRCRNGDLIANPALRAEVELLCEELASISAARGNAKGASCALDWALAVLQSTAKNQSSMLQDVLQGRETEIEYITGFLCREARRLGVPCPRNERLLREVRQLS